MKKLIQEKQLRRNRRLRFVMTVVVFLVFILTATQLFVSNRLANLGEQIEEENGKIETLSSENRILEEEIRQKESLINLSGQAQSLGFVEAKSVYYLVPQIPVAMKQ